MSKLFTREDAIELFSELIDAAVASGKTCSQIAEKNEKTKFYARTEAALIAKELAERASELPIPPYVSITIATWCLRAEIKTPVIKEIGPNGLQIAVGGGLVVTKTGSASRIELPKAEADRWLAGGDPEFKRLVEIGELVVTALSEAEARGLEEHARRFRKASASMAATTPGTVGFGAGSPATRGVFVGDPVIR